MALAACGGSKIHHPPPPDPPRCGDGNIDAVNGEQCDGTNLGDATCETQGFDRGSLGCNATTCQYDTTLCEKHCGDGTVNFGEACDGDAGVMVCPSFGFNACKADCTIDVSHCVATLLSAGPGLTQVSGGSSELGDVDPKGPGDLVMVVPGFYRVETFAYVMGQGFPTSRKLSFLRTPVQAIPGDLDGDGHQDVAVRNDDGSLDAYLSGSNQFTLAAFPDAGCGFSKLLGVDSTGQVVGVGCADGGVSGAGLFAHGLANAPRQVTASATAATAADYDHDGTLDLLAVSAGGGLTVDPGTAGAQKSLTLPSAPSELSAGDFDGDNDLDLLVIQGGAARAWENTGLGFAERQSFAGTNPTLPKVVDLDLDGLPDALWIENGGLQVRRNNGNFSFASSQYPLGAGTPLSLNVGDVDGDGDPDVAVTFSTGGSATQSYLLLNQVR
ncbi:MAG: VCBS repeat-containing protein [Myxococcaceae bacterium]